MTVSGGIVAAVVCAVLTLALTWPLARVLVRAGLVDRPNHRSMHVADVPRGGGAGMTVAVSFVLIGCVAAGLDAVALGVLGLSLGLAVVGFVDDRLNLDFTPRLVAQLVLAAAAVVIARSSSISEATSWALLPTVIVTVVWVLGSCNAVNFMDGIDGITGLNVIVFGTHLSIVASDDGLVRVPAMLAVGAAVGFLYWNAVRPRVFLGDGGAYFLGAFLALLVVLASVRTSSPLIAAAPFAVYAADTSTAFARRVLRGDDLIRGHREHVYQQLVLAGRRHLPVAWFVASCSALCSLCAIGVEREWWAPTVGVVAIALVLTAYLSSEWWLPAPPDTARRSRLPAAEASER